MSMTIRTRLSLMIAAVMLGTLLLLLAAAAALLQREVTLERDRQLELLTAESARLAAGIESGLLSKDQQKQTEARRTLIQEIQQNHGGKGLFVVFVLETPSGLRIFGEGALPNIELRLPREILALPDGFDEVLLEENPYRIHTVGTAWGKILTGVANPRLPQLLREYPFTALLGIPIVIFLSLLAGQVLARLVMKPVVKVARESEGITSQNLHRSRISYQGRDEFGVLVATLNDMIKKIGEALISIRRFTQDAAHELRTPLAVQRGELELLYQDEQLPENLQETVARALNRTRSMKKMVDDLLLLARSDNHQYPLRFEKIRMDQLVRDLGEDLAIMVDEKAVEIVVDAEKLEMEGDAALLSRMLLNLLENARKHTREGCITLRLKRDGQMACLSVSDTGTGISAENLPHVFDRFYRGETRGEGSGLGLSICRWIASAHHGDLRIESREGQGTEVSVKLPLSR